MVAGRVEFALVVIDKKTSPLAHAVTQYPKTSQIAKAKLAVDEPSVPLVQTTFIIGCFLITVFPLDQRCVATRSPIRSHLDDITDATVQCPVLDTLAYACCRHKPVYLCPLSTDLKHTLCGPRGS